MEKAMCLAVPMRVMKVEGNKAVVESHGVETLVDITLYPDLAPEDKVIVHAGFVIEKLDPAAAKDIEDAWKEYDRAMES
jgi:hydrogenase expression/formation protein HypC